MKISHTLLASGVLVSLMTAQSASAQFIFDPNGGGANTGILFDTFDQKPGSALAIGAITAQQSFINGGNGQFTLAYQANLNTLQDLNGNTVFASLSNGPQFNFTMQFEEQFTGATGVGPNSNAQFGFVNSGTNVFNMWTGAGNNLTGAGFGSGTNILSAHVVQVNSSSFSNTNVIAPALDNNGNNDWAGTSSVTGSGATDLLLQIDSFNANYFPDLALNLLKFSITSPFNTSQVVPFSQVDPSQNFNWLAGGAHASNVGSINGVNGPDFIFQADANQAIKLNVPEPEMLVLLGMGLLGFGLSRRTALKA